MDIYAHYANVLKALGDPKRAMIVDMLSCGELCACKILEKFKISQSTLSHHMNSYVRAGLLIAAMKANGHITHWMKKPSAGRYSFSMPSLPIKRAASAKRRPAAVKRVTIVNDISQIKEIML